MELREGSSGSRSNAEIHDRTGLYLSIVALILSAMAFGAVVMFPQFMDAKMDALNKRTEIAEREARLAQEDLMYLRASMAARGIPTNHFEEEEKKR